MHGSAMHYHIPCYDAVAAYDHIIGKAVHAEHKISLNLSQISEVAQAGVAAHLFIGGQENREIVLRLTILQDYLQSGN